MSDDTFIREVNEEIRQERARMIWQRFGALIIAVVVLAIAATIAYVAWDRYRAAQAAADGDRYFAAVDLAAAGDHDGAVEAFEALAGDGVGAYPYLARLRIAATLQESGDPAGAVRVLDEVAGSSAPQALRDVAAVRAGYILVDHGTTDDVRQRVERLTNESSPLRHPAREALGLSLWQDGDGEAARAFFQQLTEDLSAPGGIAQRAQLMIEVIESGVRMPAAGEAAADAPPAVEAVPAPVLGPDASIDPEAEPLAGPVDVPPAEEDVLTTPLAEQLDLPEEGEIIDAEEAPAPEAATEEPGEDALPPS